MHLHIRYPSAVFWTDRLKPGLAMIAVKHWFEFGGFPLPLCQGLHTASLSMSAFIVIHVMLM